MPYLPIDSPTSSNPDARDVGSGYPSGLALLAQLVEHLHGKEGVDGSSPSEGFHEVPAPGLVLLAVSATSEDRDVHQTSTARSRGRPLP